MTFWCSNLNAKWTAPSENVSLSMRKMRRFGSSCACAKYHLRLCSQFIHFTVSNDSVSGQWRPWSDCADAQADLGLRRPHMSKDTLLRGAVLMGIAQWAHSVLANNCCWRCCSCTSICKKSRAKSLTLTHLNVRPILVFGEFSAKSPLFHFFYYLTSLFSLFLWETTQNNIQGLKCRQAPKQSVNALPYFVVWKHARPPAAMYSKQRQYHLIYTFIILFNAIVFDVCYVYVFALLQKHAYSNILKILPPKNENFQIKNSDILHISAQNIYCG